MTDGTQTATTKHPASCNAERIIGLGDRRWRLTDDFVTTEFVDVIVRCAPDRRRWTRVRDGYRRRSQRVRTRNRRFRLEFGTRRR